CWRIAREVDLEKNLATARAAVAAALEAGINFFDHADIYCEGRAEEIFGQVLRENPGLRERIVIGTKAGIRFAGEGGLDAPYRYDSSANHLVARCEQSLQRLGIEQIDLFQIHRPDWLMDLDEVAAAFDRLHRAGKVRAFGVSNFSPAQVTLLQQAIAQPLVCNQIEVSLAQLGAFRDGTLDQCQSQRMTPLAWSPLAGGLLADGATSILRAQESYLPDPIVAELDRVAEARPCGRTAVALAWLLRHPARIVPIVGSAQPDRIHAAASALDLELTREEWYRLLAAGLSEPLR
ncbi:MAG: aldo/keto reductase, partial [Chthoniobacteraceae bacterium]